MQKIPLHWCQRIASNHWLLDGKAVMLPLCYAFPGIVDIDAVRQNLRTCFFQKMQKTVLYFGVQGQNQTINFKMVRHWCYHCDMHSPDIIDVDVGSRSKSEKEFFSIKCKTLSFTIVFKDIIKLLTLRWWGSDTTIALCIPPTLLTLM